MQPTQPGWYWDPQGMPNLFRWWDGERWTDHVSPIRNVGPPTDPPNSLRLTLNLVPPEMRLRPSLSTLIEPP